MSILAYLCLNTKVVTAFVCVRNDEAELPAIDRLCLEPAEGGSARWSERQAKEWYDGCEWPVGCDFIPSDAINQIEMWSASSYNHELIDKELGWAEGLGFNTLRVYLSSVVYANDPQRQNRPAGTEGAGREAVTGEREERLGAS